MVEEGAQALQIGGGAGGAAGELPHGAIIRTSRGDIWVKLFPDDVSGTGTTTRLPTSIVGSSACGGQAVPGLKSVRECGAVTYWPGSCDAVLACVVVQ